MKQFDMTKAEEKVVRHAESVNWDYNKIVSFIDLNINISYLQYKSLQGESLRQKTDYIINKFKPKMDTKTKVTVLGEEPKKELEKIEFVKGLRTQGDFENNTGYAPWEYKEIILLERDYLDIDGEDYDLMYCISDGYKPNCLMYGKFNDGIV